MEEGEVDRAVSFAQSFGGRAAVESAEIHFLGVASGDHVASVVADL